MHTAVVILNWNGLHFLQALLPKVVEYSHFDASIWVVDNGSRDGSIAWINTHCPEVKTIELGENLGFAKGYNEALKQITADYYLLLNSDVEVTPGWLKPLVDALDGDKEVAACQPKILSFQDRKQFEYAGGAGGFIDKNAFPFCRGRIFNSFEPDLGQYDQVTEIFWATGCCILVRAALFHELGGFDVDFFAHMEEIDLCWRMKNRGHRIMFYPQSTVYHIGGGTLSKINPRKTYLNFRNNLYILMKNYHFGNLRIKLLFRFVLDGLAAVKFIFEGHAPHALAVLRAHAAFYRRINKFRVKREHERLALDCPNPAGVYRKNIALAYFLRGKRKFSDLKKSAFLVRHKGAGNREQPVRY